MTTKDKSDSLFIPKESPKKIYKVNDRYLCPVCHKNLTDIVYNIKEGIMDYLPDYYCVYCGQSFYLGKE